VAESGGVDIGTAHRETAAIGGAGVQTFEVAKRVTVYWRPGCSSCARMLRGLRTSEVAFEEVNIWNDPSGAATVRALAHGSETVPTVVVGTVSLVNPSVATVLKVISGGSPATSHHSERPQRFRRLTIGTILVASLVVDLLGHHSLSWALDGVVVSVYVVWRVVEHWTARRLRTRSQFTNAPNEP
jgi:mycoredoxin